MRQYISESRLNDIISESIEYTVLRNQVRQIVSEELNRYVNQSINEDGNNFKSKKNSHDSARNRVKSNLRGRRGEKYLYSTLSYRLWPDLNKDTARGKFSGKLEGRDGRDFTDDEILKIDQMLRTR
jgi:hypothetical protein